MIQIILLFAASSEELYHFNFKMPFVMLFEIKVVLVHVNQFYVESFAESICTYWIAINRFVYP